MAKHRKPLPTPEEKAAKRRKKFLKKINKIVIVALAIALLITAFCTYSHFFGNPFTKASAEDEINLHVTQNYSSLNLDVSAIKYDYETACFYAEATSSTSVDTHFFVYYKAGEVWDYYEDSVTELFNTIERVEDSFTDIAKTALVQKSILAEGDHVQMGVLDFIASRESGNFHLDMPVSADIQNDFIIYVELEKTATVEAAAEALTEIKSTLDTAELPNIVLYNLKLVEGDKTLAVENVPAEDIGTEKLANDLSFALENPSSSLGDSEDQRPLRVSIS